jgi:hypothetical protein
MNTSPEQRRHLILEKLRSSGSLSMKEIISEMGISTMTAHRDAEILEQEGLARRVRGGLALPEQSVRSDRCAMCRRPVPERTRFIFPAENGAQLTACCPHCGMGMVGKLPSASGVLATDFLYGTTLSASKATFLVGSRVRLCCAPSVIAFEAREDAVSFQHGFGGEICDFDQTRVVLND